VGHGLMGTLFSGDIPRGSGRPRPAPGVLILGDLRTRDDAHGWVRSIGLR
jgi:hypothetical protein